MLWFDLLVVVTAHDDRKVSVVIILWGVYVGRRSCDHFQAGRLRRILIVSHFLVLGDGAKWVSSVLWFGEYGPLGDVRAKLLLL